MKIIEEDREFEEYIMNGGGCIAVPLEVTERGGEYAVTVYSRFRDVAEEFSDTFEGDAFSEKAKSFLRLKLAEPMKEAGYEYSEMNSSTVVRFLAEKKKLSAVPEVDGEIVMITSNEQFEKYFNNATRDIELDDDDENDVCFAIVKDECILSFAGVNDITDDGCLDINVETSVEARGKSYAAAVVISLANYLLDRGEQVCYRCRSTNAPSIRVAEKSGFIRDSLTYSFVCYDFDADEA